MTASDIIGSSLIKPPQADPDSRPKVPSNSDSAQAGCPTLLDALQVYLDQKSKGRPKTFRIAAQRSCNNVISLCVNKPLSSYSHQHALMFRDLLVKRGITGSSVTRNFSYVKVFSLRIEHKLFVSCNWVCLTQYIDDLVGQGACSRVTGSGTSMNSL
jgi:hypothetical protein